jgi:tetratricopeptide (TPR) repeat protein
MVSRDDRYVVETEDSKTTVRPQAGTSKAVLALLKKARSAALNGELARSEAFLERALRIEPRNAVLWHYMAKLRLNQGRLKQAAGLAAKSNSLDRNNKILQADNWRIIAHARHQRGDIEGAKRAQSRVDRLLSEN